MRNAVRNVVPPKPGAFPPAPPSLDWTMADLFSSGKEMDYKRHGQEFRDFGNVNYGAFGSALGYSPYVLHGMAGLQQMRDLKWEPSFGVPFLWGNYGDNQQDYDQIDNGITYYKDRKHR
jgi:hypothetical protein